jgi:hypothetical protein
MTLPRKHLKIIFQAALLACVMLVSAPVFAQARHELQKRRFNEKGEPIPESSREVCRRVFDEKFARCVNRALQSSGSGSPEPPYNRCSKKHRPSYQQCLDRTEDSPGK